MPEQIIINHRFCGPPTSGNGGYACGLLARYLPDDAQKEVRLLRPIPLETPLAVDTSDPSRALLSDGDDRVAEARFSDLRIVPPEPPTYAQAEHASRNYIGFREHPFPTCFVCGPKRVEKDGLQIFAGRLEDRTLVAANWVPAKSLANADGTVRDEFIWAALDCPGAFAVADEKLPPIVLGTLAVKIDHKLRAGEKSIVIGWKIGEEGRKAYAGTAVFSAAGHLYASGRATWIKLR